MCIRDSTLTAESIAPLMAQEVDEAESDAIEATETLNSISSEVESLYAGWKSARGWTKIQPELVDQYQQIANVVDSTDVLDGIAPLVEATQTYIAELKPKNAKDYKQAKALLEETFDVTMAGSSTLVSGQEVDSFDQLLAQLNGRAIIDDEVTSEASQSPSEGDVDPLSSVKKVEATTFVPGVLPGANKSGEEQKDISRNEKGARDRAAALRIKTETLDSLTNFVGDASMNLSLIHI